MEYKKAWFRKVAFKEINAKIVCKHKIQEAVIYITAS